MKRKQHVIPTHFTKQSSPVKLMAAILILESKLRGASDPFARSEIKGKLTQLYRVRRDQKKYTPPPIGINTNRGL